MGLQIEWKKEAENDAIEMLEYVGKDNVISAYALYNEIKIQINQLSDYPKLGKLGRIKGTRELIIADTSYIVAYRIHNNIIQILRILHSARNWNKQFSK